jgi:hypothetical protein
MAARTDWRARTGRGPRLAASLLLLGLGACASTPRPAAETARKPEPPAPQRLAWMPLDTFDGPIAQALNEKMSRTKPRGTTATVKAAVSMEVAQLAIECIQPTPACYAAVGRSMKADRLMWAELIGAASSEKIQITVVMFDVEAGKSSRRVGTFADVQAARAGVPELVDGAADPGNQPR